MHCINIHFPINMFIFIFLCAGVFQFKNEIITVIHFFNMFKFYEYIKKKLQKKIKFILKTKILQIKCI